MDAGTGGQGVDDIKNRVIEDPDDIVFEMQPGNNSQFGLHDLGSLRSGLNLQVGSGLAPGRAESFRSVKSSSSRFPKFDLGDQQIPLPAIL